MIYNSTSMIEVLGRVVRNTRLQDTSFLNDMREWIPEAMGYMKTRFQLKKQFKDVRINYYRAQMPCGLSILSAVQYGNKRLRWYNSPRRPEAMNISDPNAVSVYPGIAQDDTVVFGTHLVKREATDEGVPVSFYQTNLEPLETMGFHEEHWYFTEMGSITSSIKDGWVRIHFTGIALDDAGLPLIPDEENYKEALYYYCRAKMIGAGYEDKAFTEDKCMARYEEHARRARSRITYPSIDQMEARVNNMTRLIFPEDYWHSFYDPRQETVYNRV